jgi:RNA polymerase sigma-70 factor (ECF subfamily)
MADSALIKTYREHQGDLIRFLARRLRCAFTARDLAQDIYIKLHELDGTVETQASKAYLFRIAANLATDHIRTEQRRAELLAEAREILWAPSETRTPEREFMARQELARLKRAAATIPPLSREIFRLNRFEGKTQREIADSLGVSLTTVEKHIRKVLEHLAKAR